MVKKLGTKNIELLEHQWQFIHSGYKNNLLLGGVGSGKTFIGCAKAHYKMSLYPKGKGFIGAPTHKQLMNVTLKDFQEYCEIINVSFEYNQQKGILTVGGTVETICSSLTNYDAIRGHEFSWSWIDEGSYCARESFEMLLGRMRNKIGDRGIDITTTPKGFGYLHDYFHPDGECFTSDQKIYYASSFDNHHLPDGYVNQLIAALPKDLVQQEVYGKMLNIRVGRVYYAFDQAINVDDCAIDNNRPIYVGVDFNVDPMCAVVGQVYDNGQTESLKVIDEFYMRDLKSKATSRLAAAIKAKYGTNGVTLIPDSTGRKHTTNASKSDIQILKDAGFKIKDAQNPFRIDRYASCNAVLEKGMLSIDKSCKYLIKDLNELSYMEGTDKPDVTKNRLLGHLTDCLGYLVYRTIKPLKPKPRNKITMG